MRICVCVKRVPAPGARITLTPDGGGIDTRNLGFTTSPHEECAVEAAIQLVEAHGGEVTVLTVGPPEADEQLRYAISVGATHGALVSPDGDATADPDPQATAAAIADALRRLEADGGGFDLVLFGNESADAGGFQVGVRVARALARPMVNGAKALTVADGAAEVRRESAEGFEVFRVPLPAMVGVLEGINLPRYATLPGRLRSKKAELAVHTATVASPALVATRFEVPADEVTETRVLGEGAAAAPAVVDLLEELGLL